jgi:cbb3-type cytochrome oxidase subunit 3
VLFFSAFCAIVLYIYTGRRRGERLESYKYIPFQDEADTPDSPFRKVTDDERESN